MKTPIPHNRVVLAAPRTKVPAMLAKANAIHDAMTAASSTFNAPMPPMATLLSLIQATTTAQQATTTRTAGAAATRNVKVTDLANALESERAYVQTLVDASPELAQHLAELAGMHLLAHKPHAKPLLGLKLGQPTGAIVAKANASLLKQGRSKKLATTFNWRYTADGGKTWVVAQSTPVAHTTFTGLVPLTTYGVEVCITDTVGTTAWSDTATIVAH
jgi:hypothetical protein